MEILPERSIVEATNIDGSKHPNYYEEILLYKLMKRVKQTQTKRLLLPVDFRTASRKTCRWQGWRVYVVPFDQSALNSLR